MANRLKIKTRRYYGFIHPLLTWEYHCFGYRKEGHSSHTVHDGWEIRRSGDDFVADKKTHIVRYAYFQRHEEYPKNVLFILLELLMTIVSALRATFGHYLVIAWFILQGFEAAELASVLGSIALALYGGTVVIGVLGSLVRTFCGLDKKIDDICDENGWQKWSDYADQ